MIAKKDLFELLKGTTLSDSLCALLERHKKRVILHHWYRPAIHLAALNGIEHEILKGELLMIIKRIARLFSVPQKVVSLDIENAQGLLLEDEATREEREVEMLESWLRK